MSLAKVFNRYMYHRVKKIKFRAGRDANVMLMKKLVTNFFAKGKLQSTIKKVKVLRSTVEHLVEKSKENSQSNKNYLLRYISDQKLLNFIFLNVGPALKEKHGGYVKVIRLGARESDGAETARLEWAYPIVIKKEKKEKKQQAEPTDKKQEVAGKK